MLTSNQLCDSLVGHPHRIAAITGDSCMLEPDDFGARLSFVDYDGKAAYDAYLANPPQRKAAEVQFAEENAPRVVKGVAAIRK